MFRIRSLLRLILLRKGCSERRLRRKMRNAKKAVDQHDQYYLDTHYSDSDAANDSDSSSDIRSETDSDFYSSEEEDDSSGSSPVLVRDRKDTVLTRIETNFQDGASGVPVNDLDLSKLCTRSREPSAKERRGPSCLPSIQYQKRLEVDGMSAPDASQTKSDVDKAMDRLISCNGIFTVKDKEVVADGSKCLQLIGDACTGSEHEYCEGRCRAGSLRRRPSARSRSLASSPLYVHVEPVFASSNSLVCRSIIAEMKGNDAKLQSAGIEAKNLAENLNRKLHQYAFSSCLSSRPIMHNLQEKAA